MARVEVTEGDDITTRITSYSFGKASGSNPRGSSQLTWSGWAIAFDRDEDLLCPVQGTATIDIDDPPIQMLMYLFKLNHLSATSGNETVLPWNDVSLTNGVPANSAIMDGLPRLVGG